MRAIVIKIKAGVVFKALRPEIYRLFPILDETFADRGLNCLITSANDGKHKNGSLHYQDLAIDIRIKHLPNQIEKQRVLEELRVDAGPDYDILLECAGTLNEHIHLEYDPGE